MRMILGLDRPTSGAALVNGRPYVDSAAPLTEVGALLDAKAVDSDPAHATTCWRSRPPSVSGRDAWTQCGAPVGLGVKSSRERELDAGAAEVHERDQGSGAVEAEGAVADQADLAVEAFEAAV
jgi:ABC-2 type transport system ATP-binding protein